MVDENHKTTRRNAIKTVSSFGVAGMFVNATSAKVKAQAGGEREEVVIARGGPDDEPRSTELVPVTWKQHEDAIEKIQAALSKRYRQEKDFVNGIRLRTSNSSIDGFSFSQMEFQVSSDATHSQIQTLPESITNAPFSLTNKAPEASSEEIQVQEMSVKKDPDLLATGSCPDSKETDDLFPGGYWIENSNGSSGTSGYRVYDSDSGEQTMLTANHVVSSGCSLGTGDDVFDHKGNRIGNGTSIGNYGTDWILLGSGIDYSWADKIYNGSSEKGITGWVTSDGAKVIDSKGHTCHNFGGLTGHDTGTIAGRSVSGSTGCVNLIDQAVTVNCDFGDGDSGGPIWFENSDGNWIIGHGELYKNDGSMNCQGINGDYGNKVWTFPFFRIKSNNSNLYVGSEYNG